jgi:hypothetical protein
MKISVGQDISPQLISSCGEQFENDSYQLAWSLGECAISTLESGNFVLTQGFHQSSYEIETAIETEMGIELNLKVYPNPTTDFLILETGQFDLKEIQYQILDLKGSVLENNSFINTMERLDFSSYTNGIYFIIIKQENQIIKSFKIIKQ